MRILLLLALVAATPSAMAQRMASFDVTASHAVGLGALIDGEGFDLRTTTVSIGSTTEQGARRGVRVGIEERSNSDDPDGRALFAMVEAGASSNPAQPLGGMLVGMIGYNSLNRHARPLGYFAPSVGVEVGSWLRLGPVRVEAGASLISFAIFNGFSGHLRVGAGISL